MAKNPYNICTVDLNSNCNDCSLQNKLHCKIDKNKLIVSFLEIFSTIIISLVGILITCFAIGFWWPFIIYFIFVILFFTIIEIRVTCSHCPFYAEKSYRLRCIANYYSPKIWKFHPEPIAPWEKIVTILGFGFLGLFPLLIELYGILFVIRNESIYGPLTALVFIGILIANLLAIMTFFTMFLLLFCPECINFSCFFNKVPKSLVDEYLKKNPAIKEAWKKSGYKPNK